MTDVEVIEKYLPVAAQVNQLPLVNCVLVHSGLPKGSELFPILN
jgi:hypothetical protein